MDKPKRAAAATHQPEVCAINLDGGRIIGHARPPRQADGRTEVPGNLLYAGGVVISQTITAITAYPRLDVALAPIDALLKKNPNDPTALTERGELRLLNGDLLAAIEDLRAALAHQPPSAILRRAKIQFFDALTELGKRDLKAMEKYVDEYEKLGKEVLKERTP